MLKKTVLFFHIISFVFVHACYSKATFAQRIVQAIVQKEVRAKILDENKRKIIELHIDGNNELRNHNFVLDGSLVAQIINTYKLKAVLSKDPSVVVLDKHTKCNAPHFYDGTSGWILCQVFLKKSQFKKFGKVAT